MHRDLKPANIFIHNDTVKIGMYIKKSRLRVCTENNNELINKELNGRHASILLPTNVAVIVLFLSE